MSVIITDKLVSDPQISFKVADKIYRVLAPDGQVVSAIPHLPAERLVGFYRWMLLGRVYSDRMVALQRQGKMGTFAPLNGQEATSVGLAAPLEPQDWLLASYRDNISHLIITK